MRPDVRANLMASTLLAPWIITLLVFWAWPLVYAGALSFAQYGTLTNSITWIGLDNYRALFTSKEFGTALINTVIFTFGTVPVTTAFAILLATMVQRLHPRWAAPFRTAFFMPSVTSLVVIALIFTNLYARDGYVNALAGMIGLPQSERGWLLEPNTALASIMAMDVWISTGYYMVLVLAGMETISKDLYESAELNGASRWQQFWLITLPLLRPTLLFIVVINTIKSFQIFVEVYVMTKGGPLGATTTLVYEVYHQAFEQTDMMGYASALAYVVFIMLVILSWAQQRLLRST